MSYTLRVEPPPHVWTTSGSWYRIPRRRGLPGLVVSHAGFTSAVQRALVYQQDAELADLERLYPGD
ncbi:MAG: hypothetical protein ACRDTX_21955 [Pseudonocardiaceae bacterium]